MKKNQKILSIFSLGLMVTASLSLSLIFNNNNKSVSINRNNINYSDFYTKKDNNNSVIDYGGTNFQYQNLVDKNLVNNAQFYNKQNVLSTQSINITFNKDFYFNFFSSGTNQKIYIMVTAKDPSLAADVDNKHNFGFTPQKIETQFVQIGDAIRLGTIVMDNKLVIVGNTSLSSETSHKYALSVFNINDINDVLNPNSTHYNQSISLNKSVFLQKNVSDKLAKNDNKFKTISKQLHIPNPVDFRNYSVPIFPIYMSPVQNVSDMVQFPNILNFFVWTGGSSLADWDATNNLSPVYISFNKSSGEINYNGTENLVFPISSSQTPDPAIRTTLLDGVTKNNISVGAVVAVTPILNNGKLKIYIHQLMPFLAGRQGFTNKNSLLVEEFSMDKSNNQWYISKFINQPILASVSTQGLDFNSSGSSTIQSIQWDPTINMPYALAKKGDKDHPNGFGSSKINLLYLFGTFLLTDSSVSVMTPTIATSVYIDNSKDDSIFGSDDNDLYFYDGQNKLNTNYLFMDNYSYPEYSNNNNNLENGITIPMNYRGFTESSFQTRIGMLTWKMPWDPNVWSTNALRVGGSVFQGYTAFVNGLSRDNFPVKDAYTRYIQPTIYDEELYIAGLYKGENSATMPNVFSSTKNLLEANFSSNNLKTALPNYISIERNGSSLNPNLIGVEGIINIIKEYTKDRASNFYISNLDTNYSTSKNNELLTVNGNIMNPYAISSNIENRLSFNMNISLSPDKNDVDNPFIFNNGKITKYPSSIDDEVNYSFNSSNKNDIIFNKFRGIIGDSSNDIIQVKDSMIPFIKKLSASSDDFLGKLKIDYVISADNGITNFDYSVTVTGFWANLYILLIVLAAVILIVISILIALLVQKKRHKENLSKGLMKGINFFNKKNNKTAPPNLSNQEKTMNNQNNIIEKTNVKK